MLLAALLPSFGASTAAAQARLSTPQLAPAPYREAPQDTTGWQFPSVPKAAPARDQVASLYQSMYVPEASVALSWNGSVASCAPGTTNTDHQQAVLGRVNYFRALVGLPAVTALGTTETAQSQAAALLMAANNSLSHAPPITWLCYTASGATGAGSSNIALGVQGVDAIDLYMDDPGSGNNPVGHRRWVLYPPLASMATGDVGGGSTRPANALYVFGPSTTRPATPNGTAWPPAGFVPYQNLPAQSSRWSISYPGADFGSATVNVAGPSGTFPVTYEAIATGYGDNTLVFLPTGFPYGRPSADTTYTVTVSGIRGSGVPTTIQYSVTVIDPMVAGPTSPPTSNPPTTSGNAVTVVEYYNAVLDHYFITYLADEMARLDSGATPTAWTRTGYSFKAYGPGQGGSSPVCRFYIPPTKGDSHFFGRGTAECNATAAQHPDFLDESSSFMGTTLPTNGNCPAGTVPIYRVFSNRVDANHRYMTDTAVRQQMVARGWLAEGDGPNMVVMCGPA